MRLTQRGVQLLNLRRQLLLSFGITALVTLAIVVTTATIFAVVAGDWVKGHAGDRWNEVADQLAEAFLVRGRGRVGQFRFHLANLAHAEGLSHAEAARVLDVKESTVSWRLHEFRKRHRLALEGQP